MRRIRRLAGAAAVGSAALLLAAACGPTFSPDPVVQSPTAGAGGPGTLNLQVTEGGVLLLSDGTATVTVGGQQVTFPTTVTDAIWSPDGSRVAFIGADGNVASARPDGTDLLVYTTANSAVQRSHPTWAGATILFTEAHSDGTSTLMVAEADGGVDGATAEVQEYPHDTGDGTGYVDLYPTSRQVGLGTNDYFAFEHDEPSGHQIWIYDANRREPVEFELLAGSQPALNADGSQLAYIDKSGQLSVLDLPAHFGSGFTRDTRQVTFDVAGPSHPTWTPDGQHLVFETATDVELVSAQVPDQAVANPTTQLAAVPAVPSILASKQDSIVRISGSDAVDESIAASRAVYPTTTGFSYAQGYQGVWSAEITSVDNVGDITPNRGLPLLLTDADSLDPRVVDELHRIFGASFNEGQPALTIVGGPGLVSNTVQSQLAGLGFDVSRRTTPPSTYESLSDGPVVEPFEVVFVDAAASPAEKKLARAISSFQRAVIEIDTTQPLDAATAAWLSRSSGSINRVLLLGNVSDSFASAVGGLVSGPLGFDTATNPDPTHL